MPTNNDTTIIVESVIELTTAQTNEIKRILESKLNHSVTIKNHRNPSLIGGLKLIVGDQVINLSLSNRLQTIHQTLLKDE